MNFDELRRYADAVRTAPLEDVLLLRGAKPDRRDRRKWHTEQGSLSVTGAKFNNWQRAEGGGGAIDLVMHLAGVDFRTAVLWLQRRLATGHLVEGSPTVDACEKEASAPEGPGRLRLPAPDGRMLGRVRQYLTRRRGLAASLIEPLVRSGKLYADRRGNAVFLMVAGRAQRPVGAELRGTGPRVWRGMAPGARKDLGYFWIGAPGSREIVLCESAIDAISCCQMHPHRIGISTSGVRADPPWLPALLARHYQLYCGFDADAPGDTAAARMIALHPAIQRLCPPAHDWNDALAASR
ncbi:MAG: DUF3991 and TOPRIM domain-containing protein [Thermoguttaceae bacterium]|jgi:hypothetical protein|nr:DUF3991 and TOPRIM domain-containing protein [Thermoguttaceae bacterium]